MQTVGLVFPKFQTLTDFKIVRETFSHALITFCSKLQTQNTHPSLLNSLFGRQPTGSWLGDDERWWVMIRKEPQWVCDQLQCREPSTADPPFHPVLYLADGCSKRSAVWPRGQRSSKQALTVAMTTASTQQSGCCSLCEASAWLSTTRVNCFGGLRKAAFTRSLP